MSIEIQKKSGLELLREPFPESQINKLPKPSKQQIDEVRANYKSGIRCKICGGWHHKDVIHLDYVGHAALTNRLLDCDPNWNWEPLSYDEHGLPAIDKDGGLWIKLTVCGVTRIGYGDAGMKTGCDAMKERIGDAIRNAAMRGGGALDLWHKGVALNPISDDVDEFSSKKENQDVDVLSFKFKIIETSSLTDLSALWSIIPSHLKPFLVETKDLRKHDIEFTTFPGNLKLSGNLKPFSSDPNE